MLLTVVLGLAASGCFWEVLDAKYDTAGDAIAARAVEAGWIPEWLPADATDIREVHDIDTNASELSFAVGGLSSLRLPDDCRPVAHADTVPAYVRRGWWPDEEELRRSYSFFRCAADATPHTFVGVSHAGNRVLHWRTYAR
jgi:hypothetical protein